MSDLPNDVLSIIAKILVSKHHYRTCANLNTTCRGVHEDTKAILFRIVVIPRVWDATARKEKFRWFLEASGAEHTECVNERDLEITPLTLLASRLDSSSTQKFRISAFSTISSNHD
jgi:hypothetical protein